MPAGWVPAVIGAVGAIAGGAIGASGAESAASTQAQGAEAAANTNLQMFKTIQGQETPWISGGQQAGNYLDYLLGVPGYQGSAPGAGPSAGGGPAAGPTGTYGGAPIGAGPGYVQTTGREGIGGPGGMVGGPRLAVGPGAGGGSPGAAPGAPGPGPNPGGAPGGFGSLLQPFSLQDFYNNSPAYQFQREQGMQGVLGGDSSSAGALSGSAQKDLIGFNQGLAGTSFANAFNIYNTQQGNIYQRLFGLSQLGQNAASNTGYQGAQIAGNIGNAQYNVGSALAGGTVGATNAITGGISSALPWLQAGFNQQQPPPSSYYSGSGADDPSAQGIF